jgi:hypothetical protein
MAALKMVLSAAEKALANEQRESENAAMGLARKQQEEWAQKEASIKQQSFKPSDKATTFTAMELFKYKTEFGERFPRSLILRERHFKDSELFMNDYSSHKITQLRFHDGKLYSLEMPCPNEARKYMVQEVQHVDTGYNIETIIKVARIPG